MLILCCIGLRKFCLRYKNGLNWILSQIFLNKLLKFYYVMGLKKYRVRYTNGLQWIQPNLDWKLNCVLGLKKFSLTYTNVSRLLLPIF